MLNTCSRVFTHFYARMIASLPQLGKKDDINILDKCWYVFSGAECVFVFGLVCEQTFTLEIDWHANGDICYITNALQTVSVHLLVDSASGGYHC